MLCVLIILGTSVVLLNYIPCRVWYYLLPKNAASSSVVLQAKCTSWSLCLAAESKGWPALVGDETAPGTGGKSWQKKVGRPSPILDKDCQRHLVGAVSISKDGSTIFPFCSDADAVVLLLYRRPTKPHTSFFCFSSPLAVKQTVKVKAIDGSVGIAR